MKALNAILAGLLAAGAACGGGTTENSASSARSGDLGTGLNTVERPYAKPAAEVWDAAVSAAKSYDLKIEGDRHDRMGGELVARRAAGETVTMRVRSVDDQSSSVAVRVEPGDRNLANLLHDRIGEKLGGRARTGLFGGSTVEGLYPAPFARCAAAAEAALKAGGFELTKREVADPSAALEGRRKDAVPAAIRIAKEGEQRKATFVVGSGRSEENQASAERLKADFERTLGGAPGN